MYSFIDKCQLTDGWVASGIITGLTTSTDHRGRGILALEFNKTGLGGIAGYVSKTVPPVNISPFLANGVVSYYVYLSDITDVAMIQMILGEDVNTWCFNSPVGELVAGWNHIEHPLCIYDGCFASPAANIISFVQFGIVMNLAADTLHDIRLNDIEVYSRILVAA